LNSFEKYYLGKVLDGVGRFRVGKMSHAHLFALQVRANLVANLLALSIASALHNHIQTKCDILARRYFQ